MKKFFKIAFLFVSLLFSNLFSADFMQKDFKPNLAWLEKKPKSSEKDFFIVQYLKDENLSYEEAKKAYDMRNGRNATLEKLFKEKFKAQLSPEDKFCYNASIEELKTLDARCMALGLASLKRVSELQKKDLDFFSSKLNSYPSLKTNLELLASNKLLEVLAKTSNDKFFEIFFNVSESYRYKHFNKILGKNYIEKLLSHKDFPKFVRTVIYDKNFNNLQKSFNSLIGNEKLTSELSFILGINAINQKNITLAKDFFAYSNKKALFRAEKDKALFWLYLVSEEKKYLEELAKSFDVNLYSLYAKELLNLEANNIVHNIETKNTKSSYNIYDVFSWLEINKASKNNLDENKLLKYYELFSDSSMEAHLAFILERYNKQKLHYFITPYRDLIKSYGIYKQILIYSIARQESRFIPSSISFSGAQGMMQIMPFLSEEIAKKLNETYNIYEQFIPEKNIAYASFHLDTLIKQFDDNPLFIAYAYNGGAGYTRRQLNKGLFKNKGKFEPFLSMEMISYAETREYGKKVLANFYIYNNYLNSENKIKLATIFENLLWQH